MGHYLLAVLVADFATVADIDIHLLKPMRRLLRARRVDDYRLGGGADAHESGRPAGTVLAMPFDWAPHPGDLVPLAQLMGPDWRFPPNRSPHAWVVHPGVSAFG